jgi:hypothetical protein
MHHVVAGDDDYRLITKDLRYDRNNKNRIEKSSYSVNMNSFQLTGTNMDSRNLDARESPGYDADNDTSVGSVDEDEYEESTPNRKCRPSPLMKVPCRRRRRKRRRHETHSQRPLISVVHPDIESSLTTHIVARRQQFLLQHRNPTTTSEPPMSLYDLSHLLEDYFQQQHASYEAPAPVSDEDYLSAEQELNVSDFSRRRGNHRSQVRYNNERLFLEEAIGFSSNARILVEASPLHRVVHTNAAFCSLTAEQEASHNTQESAMTRIQPSNSFERVVYAMFADRPVTVCPVQDSGGSGVIRYYLVEHTTAVATAASTKKRLVTNIAESTQTVG